MSKINIEREEFIRVGTTLYKLVNQPRLNGGYVLIISDIHSQQILINKDLLLKRERTSRFVSLLVVCFVNGLLREC